MLKKPLTWTHKIDDIINLLLEINSHNEWIP